MAEDRRRLLWMSLADERAGRELSWLSRMPGTSTWAATSGSVPAGVTKVPMTYRRPIRRFVEAGALAWMRDLQRLPTGMDWVASLELCSLVTGQAGRWARSHGVRQAVLTWENLVHQPLYHLPPYRYAFQQSLEADLLLCLVEPARAHLLEHGVDEERIRVVRPGVDTAVFRPAADPVVDPVVAFVSPLAANKGIDTLLQAIRIVRSSVPEARLVVMGRGPLEPLVRRAAADPSSGVEYRGVGGAGAVADTLRQALVFSTAPRANWKWNEQFGLAYLEAMACGLPVVTTVCGTNDEAVKPPNLRTSNNPEALAAGLVRFLSDPSLAAQVGLENRSRVLAEHDLGEQAHRMEAAFRSREEQR